MSPFCFDSFADRYFEASSSAESEPELLFHMLMRRLLHPEATLQPQFSYKTRRGSFRADFLLITAKGEHILLEVDGKEFHDPVRDMFRDAFTLADQVVQHVYRFEAQTIFRGIWYAVFALYRHHDGIFTQPAIDEIRDKASRFVPADDMLPCDLPKCPEPITINPQRDFSAYMDHAGDILVRSGINERGAPLFGVDLIEFARQNPGKDIDWLTSEWTSRFFNPLPRIDIEALEREWDILFGNQNDDLDPDLFDRPYR